jgi:hypothetical protein
VKRSIYTVSLLGLSLLLGSACTNRRELREGAREERREATETRSEAREEAREAREAERQAAQPQQTDTSQVERQPVAGRQPILMLEESIRSELGNDWIVTRSNDTVAATRKAVKAPARALSQKVSDQIRSLRDDHGNLTVEIRRSDAITIHGDIAECDDAGDVVENFAKLDGINQINVRVNCLSK